MQLSFNRRAQAAAAAGDSAAERRLADLAEGETAEVARLDLPQEMSHRLMELGFLPGMRVTAARCAPGGDPRVFQLDGAEVALRRDTAARVFLKM